MAGIAGVAAPGKEALVERMLDTIAHRGPAGREIVATDGATLGAVWPRGQSAAEVVLPRSRGVQDGSRHGPLARAEVAGSHLTLSRGPFGVAPLYYGQTDDDTTLCFASEVKALLPVTGNVRVLPPGYHYVGGRLEGYFRLEKQSVLDDGPEDTARELRRRLAAAVIKCMSSDDIGSWLSGGLDSSTIVALARPHTGRLHTFAAGLEGAPDLEHARVVAAYLKTDHHEMVITVDDLVAVLPEVIYHLESFDALLVRSSLTNYLVARLAADYVPAVLSGEGGDELFAGYDYLKALDPKDLPDELIDITRRLHNTALQRVDRCAAAHGIVAHVPFLDPDVAGYALRIATGLKLRGGVEKWILRQAMAGGLPERVLNRTKAKFWEGAGIGEQIAERAARLISGAEFARERVLPDGQALRSKEELMYYRIFRQHFGDLVDLQWMGRTKAV